MSTFFPPVTGSGPGQVPSSGGGGGASYIPALAAGASSSGSALISGAGTGAGIGFSVGGPIGAGVGAVVGGLIGWLSKKKGDDKKKSYENTVAQLHNEWLRTRDANVKQILDQLQARGKDIFADEIRTQEGTSTTSSSESEMPVITGEYQPLAGMQRALVEKRLANPLTEAGLAETGAEAINQASRSALNDISNLARERGLSEDVLKIGSPAEQSRLGQIAAMKANIPWQLREAQTGDVNLASSLISAFGRGTKRRGTSTTNQFMKETSPVDYNALLNFLTPAGPQAALQK